MTVSPEPTVSTPLFAAALVDPEHVIPFAWGAQERFTAPLNAFCGVTEIVAVVESVPTTSDFVLGAVAMVKLGAEAGCMINTKAVSAVSAEFAVDDPRTVKLYVPTAMSPGIPMFRDPLIPVWVEPEQEIPAGGVTQERVTVPL